MRRITKIEGKKKNAEKKLRVAAYCRVSTGQEEQLKSLREQREHYQQLIHMHDDWTFAGIYYDEGITGTKMEKRPELLRLLRDCERGKVDLVLTKSISRFARNTTDCLKMVRMLSANGVGIYFESENINTLQMEDEFILTVLGSLSANESLSISENEKWSAQKQFQNGTFKQAMAPYGYSVKDGKLLIDEDQAKVIHFIFDEADAGKGTLKIAQELNAKGIKPLKSDRWEAGSIKGILKNERYIGDALYQKTYSDSNLVRHVNHGECDQYLHRDHHEPIISREQFERVQELTGQHRKEKNISGGSVKYQNQYPFSRKIVCEECGKHLKRKIIKARVSGPYIVWECPTHVKDKDMCSLKVIQDEAIKNAFVTVTNKLIFSKKDLLIPFVKEIQERGEGDGGLEIDDINEKLKTNLERVKKLETLAAAGLLDPTALSKAMAELSIERSDLNSKKAAIGVQMEDNYHGISEAGKLLKQINQMKISSDFDEDFFSEFVKEVHAYSRTELGFEFTCGLIFREEVKDG